MNPLAVVVALLGLQEAPKLEGWRYTFPPPIVDLSTPGSPAAQKGESGVITTLPTSPGHMTALFGPPARTAWELLVGRGWWFEQDGGTGVWLVLEIAPGGLDVRYLCDERWPLEAGAGATIVREGAYALYDLLQDVAPVSTTP